MPPEQIRNKRAKLLTQARNAERVGTPEGKHIAMRCRTLVANLNLMLSDDPVDRERGQLMYEKNKDDLDAFIAQR